MSLADKIFIENCKQILENGTSTIGEYNRARWDDNKPAYTIRKFGIMNRYDLRKEFPAITLRHTAIKSAADEMLWIYQKKSNNIADLNSHIWDSWADQSGSIGKAYGYQVSRKIVRRDKSYEPEYILEHKDEFDEKIVSNVKHELEICKIYDGDRRLTVKIGRLMDQMDATLYDLKHDPFSRRIIISLWDVEELSEMNLQPCCWSINFVVTKEQNNLVLNMVLHQRSADMLTANNWNVTQYAILLMMVAQSVDMVPGELVHVIADAHIYDRHIPIVKELLSKPTFDAPEVTLNTEIKDFYKFTTKDINIKNYAYNDFNYKIPVAI